MTGWSVDGKALLATALCLLPIGCAADREPVEPARRAFVEACSQVACRPVRYVTLEAPDGARVQVPVADDPYVYEGRISLLTGEAFRVEPVLSQGRIVDLAYLGESQSPVRAFDLRLERQGGSVVLEFGNPFPRNVQFQLAARRDGVYRTLDQGFCVVEASGRGTANWPGGVEGVLIYDVAFADPVMVPNGGCL